MTLKGNANGSCCTLAKNKGGKSVASPPICQETLSGIVDPTVICSEVLSSLLGGQQEKWSSELHSHPL